MSILKYLVPIVLAATTAGCIDSPTSPSDYAAFSQEDIITGAGATAAAGGSVTVKYTGWVYDGSKPDHKGLQFDTSEGGSPFTFTLGAGSVIAGWEKGVPGMKVGGLRRLVIPPSLAYGDARSGKIPANATLIFEIELTSA
jgi:FKBP-type peptidyl-prolyl cis-trans isomerase